ncbi:MAG TPA: NAD-dependent epimerase/dehydratase family protein [Gaiellaceae bacterium]|nr:NAD-dependent epimerase/dehydratase family protein [Gaiellaceae bacterium]
MRVLVTGGAGFVGANLAIALAERHPDWNVVAFDNLHRRGSELNVPRLRAAGVTFAHGDIREPADLDEVGEVEAIVECSAEPSVMAGLDSGADYVVRTNLLGAHHCLELARKHGAQLVFLSTSRVYPVEPQNALRYREEETRFELEPEQPYEGVSERGISERFPLAGARTLYGATKLAAELLITEYAAAFGLKTVVDRFGVIAGPSQMGKVDQGVFTHWMLSHYFRRELTYLGYGGRGKQVRDLIAIEDVVELVEDQLLRPDHWAGFVANVGGGREISLSLAETTELCEELTGNRISIGSDPQTRAGDVPIYLSDCDLLYGHTDWRPRRGPRQILEAIFLWINQHERAVERALG